MSAETQKVDVLAILDSHAEGIELAYKQARGANREATAEALCEFNTARDAVAELIEATSELCEHVEPHLRDYGFVYFWKLEKAKRALARIGGAA